MKLVRQPRIQRRDTVLAEARLGDRQASYSYDKLVGLRFGFVDPTSAYRYRVELTPDDAMALCNWLTENLIRPGAI